MQDKDLKNMVSSPLTSLHRRMRRNIPSAYPRMSSQQPEKSELSATCNRTGCVCRKLEIFSGFTKNHDISVYLADLPKIMTYLYQICHDFW